MKHLLAMLAFMTNVCFATPGTIIIAKDAQPNSPQDFVFRISHPAPTFFSLDDDLDPTLSNTQTFQVSEGTYVVKEEPTVGWQLVSIMCTENKTQDTIVSLPARHAVIKVDEGETVACVFVNQALNPTAAEVLVSGRVLNSLGRAIPNATIRVNDLIHNKVYVGRSNSFGYYSVNGPQAGSFCEISATAKGHQFNPVYMNLMDSVDGLDFIPIEPTVKTSK